MSLKSNLNQIIKDRNGGIYSINELEAYCKKVPCKLASAERKLRPSESPNLERVMKKGYIIGYKYKEIPEWFPNEGDKEYWNEKNNTQGPTQKTLAFTR